MLRRRTAIAATAALLVSRKSHAQNWPDRPIRIVVPFAAGNSSDLMARLLVEPLTKSLGQLVIVDNRSGAGGTLGTEHVARQPPDGYTLLMATSGATAIAPTLYGKLGYNPITDLAPIALVASVPQLFLVKANSPIRSIADLIAAARAKPGTLAYGSGGTGSTQHLNVALFSSMTGTEFVHIPYRGSAAALNDLMAGQTDFTPETLTAAVDLVKSRTVRALAVTSTERSSFFPDVPTMQEAGVTNYEAVGWMGLMAPAQVPKPVVNRLVKQVAAAMVLPEVTSRVQDIAMTPTLLEGEEFGIFIRSEIEKWGAVVRASGAKVDG
jgi:tripartite-type tricarboxylate transporter receptor subunit TctC